MRIRFLMIVFFMFNQAKAGSLNSYNILEDQISVSGLSSGGYMATQFHVAHSKRIMGAAILAAGPYYCASGSFRLALSRCTDDDQGQPVVPVQSLINFTKNEASQGHIDELSYLRDDKVWIYVAGSDNTVEEPVTDALATYYSEFVTSNNIKNKQINNAEHGFPTVDKGLPCDVKGSPFINRCQFDGAKALFEHIYGELEEKVEPTGQVIRFSQAEFEMPAMNSMGAAGHVYVPNTCANGAECKLHIAFHGCKQTENFIGDAYFTDTGYNAWAESNNIVVLYPQSKPSHKPFNPNGCWDWWGYGDSEYNRKSAKQITAINNMVDRLVGRD